MTSLDPVPRSPTKMCIRDRFYDWSNIDQKWRDAKIFPIMSEGALRATLGILDRTVRRGYTRG